MPAINQTAAYVRLAPDQNTIATIVKGLKRKAECNDVERIWERLSTPQTVESLCSALANDPQCPAVNRTGVVAVMNRLYEQELIGLSPDS